MLKWSRYAAPGLPSHWPLTTSPDIPVEKYSHVPRGLRTQSVVQRPLEPTNNMYTSNTHVNLGPIRDSEPPECQQSDLVIVI
jgi:hypothetical protein